MPGLGFAEAGHAGVRRTRDHALHAARAPRTRLAEAAAARVTLMRREREPDAERRHPPALDFARIRPGYTVSSSEDDCESSGAIELVANA